MPDKPKPKRTRRLIDPTRHWARGTNFYPLGDPDGALDPVAPIRPVDFQPVVPSYERSTNETRESGLGPPFDAAPHFAEYRERAIESPVDAEEEANEEKPQRHPPEPGTGERLDLDA